MNKSRVKMRHTYGQTPRNVFSDFDWIRRHEKELLEKYGEKSIIVFNQQVIGVGDSYDDAVKDAELNLPPDIMEITPVHERLHHRHPFFRVYPKLKSDKS
jgi:hypothetical protein